MYIKKPTKRLLYSDIMGFKVLQVWLKTNATELHVHVSKYNNIMVHVQKYGNTMIMT